MSENVYARSYKYIKEKLTAANRYLILEIKAKLLEEKTYGVKFGSRELYDAVLNSNVDSAESFAIYLEEKAHKNEHK